MPKRILLGFVLVALCTALALAQVPINRKAFPPRAKPGPKAAVTVIDLRDTAGDKKPPKRAMDAPVSMRMMPGSGAKGNAAEALALGPAELGAALQQAGITVAPSGVYARLIPGQSSARGKGYLALMKPDAAFPDHADFTPAPTHNDPGNFNGPRVVLREPGTYSFDFLVEFANVPVDTFCNCVVLIGQNQMQLKVVRKTEGAQHIVVVWTLSPERAALPDEQRSLGIYCYLPSAAQGVPWTLYLVDVTKL